MSRIKGKVMGPHLRFPRVSGDEPRRQSDQERRDRFSPRERG